MKRSIAVILVLVMLLGFAGCSSDSGISFVESQSTQDEINPKTSTHPAIEPSTRSVAEVRDHDEVLNKVLNAPLKNRRKELKVEFIDQNPELPTGCESVALTSALRYLGFQLEKTDFADYYLGFSDEVMWGFVGEPDTDYGAGIYPPGLVMNANDYLAEQDSDYHAYNTMGTELTDLYKLVDAGFPVVVWTTIDYSVPNLEFDVPFYYEDEEFYWYLNEHCVVLGGYDLDAGTVTLTDPTNGVVTIDAEQFGYVYNIIGELSMVVMK